MTAVLEDLTPREDIDTGEARACLERHLDDLERWAHDVERAGAGTARLVAAIVRAGVANIEAAIPPKYLRQQEAVDLARRAIALAEFTRSLHR